MKNFKRIIAAGLAVLMVAAIPVFAFAAPGSGTPIGDQGVQDSYVMEAARLGVYCGGMDFPEEELWDYDENTHRYTDNEGNIWRRYDGLNWIVSKENEQWLYRELEDGSLYIISNPDVGIDQNLEIPSVLEGKTVTRVRGAGVGTHSIYSGVAPTLSITIPDTVTAIDHRAFRNRGALKRVVIPTSVKSIEVLAFELTDNVELYYTGSEEQWNNIVVWNHADYFKDPEHWAVTGFNWLERPYANPDSLSENTDVKAIHFNVNPDELEPLVWEGIEEQEPNIFEKIISGISGIIATITAFFKRIFGLL